MDRVLRKRTGGGGSSMTLPPKKVNIVVTSKLSYHPLLNEDILHQILHDQLFERLKELRVVHTTWDSAAGRLMTPKCRTVDVCDISKMEKLTELLSISDNFPCKSFSVDCAVADAKEVSRETVTKFFRVVSPWVTHLELTNLKTTSPLFGDHGAPENITYPELKSVAVAINMSRQDGYRANLATVRTILQKAPELVGVHLDAARANMATSTEFLHLMEGVPKFKVTYLRIWEDLSDKHLRLFMNYSAIRLTEIDLTIDKDNHKLITAEALKQFLESQNTTLTTLHLTYWLKKENFTLELPPLPELTTLKMEGRSADLDGLIESAYFLYLENVSAAEKLPKLKCLSLVDRGIHNLWRFAGNGLPPVETVEELELGTTIVAGVISDVGRMFPRVKKLALPNVYSIFFTLSRAGMSQVDELTLLMSDFNNSADESLLGFEDVDDAVTVTDLKLDGPWLSMIEKIFQPPKFLNQLKVLKMEVCHGNFDGPYLSDRGCRLVLLKLQNLRCLHFGCSRKDKLLEISDEMLEKMKSKFTVSFEE